MTTLNVPARMSLKPDRTWSTDRLASSKSLGESIVFDYRPKRENGRKQMFSVRSVRITQQSSGGSPASPNGPVGGVVSFPILSIWVVVLISCVSLSLFCIACLVRLLKD